MTIPGVRDCMEEGCDFPTFKILTTGLRSERCVKHANAHKQTLENERVAAAIEKLHDDMPEGDHKPYFLPDALIPTTTEKEHHVR